MEESLIVVDDIGRFLDYASYEECHVGQGRRHRAFVTLLFDKDNWVFLHRRRHNLHRLLLPVYMLGKKQYQVLMQLFQLNTALTVREKRMWMQSHLSLLILQAPG